MLRRLVPHLHHLSPGRVFLLVWIPLFSLFFATAQKSTVHSLDTYTNVLTAWSLASEHTIYADPTPGPANPGDYGIISWFTTTSSGRLVSQYPPGAALVAAPFYLASPATRQVTLPEGATRLPGEVTVNLPSLVPAAVAASLTSSLAIALLGLLFLDFLTPAQTVAGAYIAGLGTSAWSVASDALWQHGPAMLWIALALYLISRDHRLWAGVAFGMAILTRPHLALDCRLSRHCRHHREASDSVPCWRVGAGALSRTGSTGRVQLGRLRIGVRFRRIRIRLHRSASSLPSRLVSAQHPRCSA